jgi:CRP-like cAMP-binding protein
MDRKVAYCRETFPLNKLNSSNQASLRYCLNECHFVRNDVVIAHGKESNSVFFVVEGQFTVSMVTPTESEEGVREMTLCTLSAGESFGEHELLSRDSKHGLIPTRQYTVTTSSAPGPLCNSPENSSSAVSAVSHDLLSPLIAHHSYSPLRHYSHA